MSQQLEQIVAKFFIDRPIFAWVIALVIMAAGLLALRGLPLEQYPNIASPRISISAEYTGASAQTVNDSVTQVIEQQLNGIDRLQYITATSDSSGRSRITLTLEPGTDADVAQVQVQNKLEQASNRLPESVRDRGVRVSKGGQDNLVTWAFTSPLPEVNRVMIGDYLASSVVDQIARLDGVAEVSLYGTPFAIRIWLKPERLRQFQLMPSDVRAALLSQNTQISAGQLGQQPVVADQQLNTTITARDKLTSVEEFEAIILKSEPSGATITLKDVARVELAADNLQIQSRFNGLTSSGIGIVMADGANALEVSDRIRAEIEKLKPHFPYQLQASATADSTPFVRASIKAVVMTLLEAVALVVIVMFLFLQNWRATLIPAITVPVVILGTFAVLLALGYSINMLTMFALVLAIGLLVDDAIVVVENVERVMREQALNAREATIQSMQEITPALIGIGLTLSAVFLPMAFFPGTTGIIYRQFAATLVTSMLLSVLVAIVLTPALCAQWLTAVHADKLPKPLALINRAINKSQQQYAGLTGKLLARKKTLFLVYLLLIGSGLALARNLPAEFIPVEDQGYFDVRVMLPPGAVASRTDEVLDELYHYFKEQEDVASVLVLSGIGGQNNGRLTVRLKDWSERDKTSMQLADQARKDISHIRDARLIVSLPPVVRGLGSTGGFSFYLIDNSNLGLEGLNEAREQLMSMARAQPEIAQMFAFQQEANPTLHLTIDEPRAAALGINSADINSLISAALGGSYVNDFVHNGRVKRVYVQGEAEGRMLPSDIAKWSVRNNRGEMISLDNILQQSWQMRPPELARFNGSPALEISGEVAPNVSIGKAMQVLENLSAQLPSGASIAWTGAALEAQKSSQQAPLVYAASCIFVFLCLAALYESWRVPAAVILAALFGAIGAVTFTFGRGLANDVFFQVGLITAIGLAAKNAILIVEFAMQLFHQGIALKEAIIRAASLRLRPLLMTSLAFGVGVIPLSLATGPGAASRVAIGTAVLGGTFIGTLLCLLLVPVAILWVQRERRADCTPQ